MTSKLTRLILLSTSTLAVMSAGIGEAMAASKVILEKKGLRKLISGKEKFQEFSIKEGTLPYKVWTEKTNKTFTKLIDKSYTYMGESIVEGEAVHTFAMNVVEENNPKQANTFLERYKKKLKHKTNNGKNKQ